jgi:hypothetical protein
MSDGADTNLDSSPAACPAGSPAAPRGARWDLALLLLLVLLLAVRFWNHTADDAFISFRYARNLVAGQGLVFNPGERVEGYTNFLWVILSAGAIAAGVNPVLFARLASIAAGLVMVACVHRAALRLTRSRVLAVGGGLLLVLSPPVAVWTTGGLETLLFACLVTWATWLVAEGADEGRLPVASALLLGAATLTRPEGFLVAASLAGVTCLPALRPAYTTRRRVVWAAVFLAVFVPFFVWRTMYYGDLLPNTFHAKIGSGGLQIVRGIRYLRDFVVDCGCWIPLALAGLCLGLRRKPMAVLAGVALPYLAYIVYVGGDALPMYRFFVPILGILAVAAIAAAGAAAARLPARAARHAAPIAAAILAAAALIDMRAAFTGRAFAFVEQDRREVRLWQEIGLWFRRHAAPGESIALIPAGAIPYYSGLVTIDMLGLNDRTIARAPAPAIGSGPAGHERHDAGYVLSRDPTYILLGVYEARPTRPSADQTLTLYYPAEIELARMPEFQERYRPVSGRVASGYFTFYARADKTFPE